MISGKLLCSVGEESELGWIEDIPALRVVVEKRISLGHRTEVEDSLISGPLEGIQLIGIRLDHLVLLVHHLMEFILKFFVQRHFHI